MAHLRIGVHDQLHHLPQLFRIKLLQFWYQLLFGLGSARTFIIVGVSWLFGFGSGMSPPVIFGIFPFISSSISFAKMRDTGVGHRNSSKIVLNQLPKKFLHLVRLPIDPLHKPNPYRSSLIVQFTIIPNNLHVVYHFLQPLVLIPLEFLIYSAEVHRFFDD